MGSAIAFRYAEAAIVQSSTILAWVYIVGAQWLILRRRSIVVKGVNRMIGRAPDATN